VPVTLALGRVSELYPRAQGLKLTLPEAKRAAGFKAPARRRQYLAGRWLLRQLCCRCVAGAPADWGLNASGAPQAAHRHGYGAPQLSLAHSGDWIAATAAFGIVAGVDIERLGQTRDWSLLLKRHKRAVPSKGREAAFLHFWTADEARIKSGWVGPARHLSAEGMMGAIQVPKGSPVRVWFFGEPPGRWHLDGS